MLMDNILKQTRCGFMGSALGAAGAVLLPADAFGTGGKPIMSMGMVSDEHFKEAEPNPLKEQEPEKVFRFFDSCGVDAVVFSGDMANGLDLTKKRMNLPGLYLIAASRLQKGKPITFAIAPVECFGKRGNAIRNEEVVV
jgi:hypothetical protein